MSKTVKAITFSKVGDVSVIEKTEPAFPEQGPGDVILKVNAAVVCFTRLFNAFVGRVCWSKLHRHLFQERNLSRYPPLYRWNGSRWGDRRAPYRPGRVEPPRVQGERLCCRSEGYRCTHDSKTFRT